MNAKQLEQVERRLVWHKDGVTEQQLGHSLGWAVGAGAACRQLQEQGKAHRVGDRWYHGPGVQTQRPPTRRAAVARDLVLDDVRANPGTSAGEVARRLSVPSASVSTALQDLRRAGRVLVHGQRVHARWTAASETDTPEVAPPHGHGSPGPGVETTAETSSCADAGLADGAASLLLWLLDEFGVPAMPDLKLRVGVAVGMWQARR